jgi:hypothetical protein
MREARKPIDLLVGIIPLTTDKTRESGGLFHFLQADEFSKLFTRKA